MSGGNYFEWILIYSAHDIGVSKKNPSYQMIEILHLCVHMILSVSRLASAVNSTNTLLARVYGHYEASMQF